MKKKLKFTWHILKRKQKEILRLSLPVWFFLSDPTEITYQYNTNFQVLKDPEF